MDDIRQWSAAAFEVDSTGPVALGIDGEAVRMAPPLRFESRPGALRVRLPAAARGLSPSAAAVGLSRRDLRRLVASRPAGDRRGRKPSDRPDRRTGPMTERTAAGPTAGPTTAGPTTAGPTTTGPTTGPGGPGPHALPARWPGWRSPASC